jgi:hypothetical protein
MPVPLIHAPEPRGRSLALPFGRSDTNACGTVEVEWNVRDEEKKLVMDLSGAMPLHADMDDDRRDLIVGLCAQAGMIMEDTTDLAHTARGVTDEDLANRVDEIDVDIRRMGALIVAAIALYPRV